MYDEKCDIWALGVIAYLLFSQGEYPFNSESEAGIFKNISKAKFYLPPKSEREWKCNAAGGQFDWNFMMSE